MPNFSNQYRHLRGPETTQKCQILNGHDPNINSSHSVEFGKKIELQVGFSALGTLCPPLDEIGLTDLPKSGGAMAPPAPPGTTPLYYA